MRIQSGSFLPEEMFPSWGRACSDRQKSMFMFAKAGDYRCALAPMPCGGLWVVSAIPDSDPDGAINMISDLELCGNEASRDAVRKAGYRDDRKPIQTSSYSQFNYINMPDDRSLFDCALAYVWSACIPASRKSQMDMVEAFYCSEFRELSHAVSMSDWDWVDVDSDNWWMEFNPFDIDILTELARNALWWHRSFPPGMAIITEDVF